MRLNPLRRDLSPVARFFQEISRLSGLQEGTRGGIEAHPAPEFYVVTRVTIIGRRPR